MSSGRTLYKRRYKTTIDDVGSDVFARVQGRLFERWIEYNQGNARSTGFYATNMVQQPPYIIESLIRDELLVERDLQIDSLNPISYNEVVINALLSDQDDYYNYAIYYNVTRNFKTYITDYDGATKTLTLHTPALQGNGDNIILTNVRGDYKIDITSFDVVGNNTNGTRKGWIFARPYTQKESIWNLISELCFESHCQFIESTNPNTGEVLYKLVAIDSGSGDTWTNPAYSDGLEQLRISFTPLENVYTKFRLRYRFDYGKNDFLKEITVDKNGFPKDATVLSATEQTLCSDAETNYKVSQFREFTSYNITTLATAERFLQKKIQWFTKQRMIVNYVTPIVGNLDYIKYEIGDQVKLNFSKGIPTGINNSSYFMITSKRVTPLIGGGHIVWELLEL